MPLESSEFLLIVLFIILLAVAIFSFTMGILVRGDLAKFLHKPKSKDRSKVKEKRQPRKKKRTASKDGLCLLPNGKVGMLKKLKDKSYDQVSPKCNPFDCENFFKCIGIEKK